MQLPLETSDIYAVTGSRVAMTAQELLPVSEGHHASRREERTGMSRLIGCFESWTSRCCESPGEV